MMVEVVDQLHLAVVPHAAEPHEYAESIPLVFQEHVVAISNSEYVGGNEYFEALSLRQMVDSWQPKRECCCDC
jgi:hypothetical protein